MADPSPAEKSTLRTAWDWATGLPGQVWEGAKNLWNGTTKKVTDTFNSATQYVADTKQSLEDKAEDLKHPIYTAIKMALSGIFGKAAMRGVVEMALGFFDKGNAQGFGSGEFSETLQRWDREFSRDLGQEPLKPKPAAVPAPA